MILREKTREALLWGAGFKLFRDALQFGVMLILVRLLDPGDYGRWGLLSSVIGFFGLASAKTFFSHVLQVRRDEEVHEQDQFTAGAVIQLVLFAAVNVAAVVLRTSDTYGSIAPLLHLASLSFLIEMPGEFWARLLERRLDFRRQRLLLGIGILMVSALSLTLAFAGAGVLALVIPPMLLSLPFAWDLARRRRFRPTWEFDRERYRPTARFAIARIASGGLNGLRDLAQSTLVVRFAGFASLGYLGRAMGLGNLFCAGVASQLVSNVYPVLTRHEPRSPGFRRASGLLLRGVSWIVVPVAVLLGLYAGPVVRVLYGEKWIAVIPLLPLAMLESVVRALSSTIYSMLLAAGRHRHCFHQDLLVLTLVIGALAAGMPRRVGTYLVLLSLAEALGAALMLWWLLRSAALEPRELVLALAPTAIAAGVGVAAAMGVASLLGRMSPETVRLSSSVAAFSVCYLATLRVLFARALGELLDYFPGGDWFARILLIRRNEATLGPGG